VTLVLAIAALWLMPFAAVVVMARRAPLDGSASAITNVTDIRSRRPA
jgi:hypothetical protein